MKEQDVQQWIKRNGEMLKKNLIKTSAVEGFIRGVRDFLGDKIKEKSIKPDSELAALIEKTSYKVATLWSSGDGFPTPKNAALEAALPWIDLYEQYFELKTISKRHQTGDNYIESRMQGAESDWHFVIGDRTSTDKTKARMTIDAQHGDIRTEDNRDLPEKYFPKIEVKLHKEDGNVVHVVRQRDQVEFTEYLSEANTPARPIIDTKNGFSMSNGPKGSFFAFEIENKGSLPAANVRGLLLAEGIGKDEIIELPLSQGLSAGEKTGNVQIGIRGTAFYERGLGNVYVIFIATDFNGKTWINGKCFQQEARSDGKYHLTGNGNTTLTNEEAETVFINKTDIDRIVRLTGGKKRFSKAAITKERVREGIRKAGYQIGVMIPVEHLFSDHLKDKEITVQDLTYLMRELAEEGLISSYTGHMDDLTTVKLTAKGKHWVYND